MNIVRKYGNAPFTVAVIHGGPGAPGSVTPIAKDLSKYFGTLEPIQTEDSIDGQILELKMILSKHCNLPITLIGHSWGAWLGYIFTSRYSSQIKKLILVGSGPFENKYIKKMNENRFKNFNKGDRKEYSSLIKALTVAKVEKNTLLKRLGELTLKSDMYDPIIDDSNESSLINAQGEIYQNVWNEASKLRECGKLLKIGRSIKCPVIAIHGDHDPAPAEGIRKPLSSILENFRIIILKDCGHYPWREINAKDKFYEILLEEINDK